MRLLIGLGLLGLVAFSTVPLLRRRLHPLQVLQRGLSGAALLGMVGLSGTLPAALWWVVWLVALLLVVGLAVGARHAQDPGSAADDALPAPPSRGSLIGDGVLLAVVFAVAPTAG